MKRLKLNDDQVNFIGIWNIENQQLCKDIINFFEKNIDLQKDGSTSDGKKYEIKKNYRYKCSP